MECVRVIQILNFVLVLVHPMPIRWESTVFPCIPILIVFLLCKIRCDSLPCSCGVNLLLELDILRLGDPELVNARRRMCRTLIQFLVR